MFINFRKIGHSGIVPFTKTGKEEIHEVGQQIKEK